MRRLKVFLGLSLVGSLCWATPAHAILPTHQTIEKFIPGTGWLSGRDDTATQIAVRSQRPFVLRQGGRWQERAEARYGMFYRVWGSGVALNQSVMRDANAAARAAGDFWQENADLLPFGVAAEDLSLSLNERSGRVRFVRHDQTLAGVPVVGARNWMAIINNRVVMVSVRSYPVSTEFDAKPALNADEALKHAALAVAARGVIEPSGSAPSLAALPVVTPNSVTYRLVYAVDIDGENGRWNAYVDAKSGELVALKDLRMWGDAQLRLSHHNEAIVPGEPLIDSPGPYLTLNTDGGSVETDADGMFEISGESSSISTSLSGKYFRVVDKSGGSGLQLSASVSDGEAHVWETDGSEFQQAQMDSYRFSSDVRDHVKSWGDVVDGLAFLDQMMPVNVNINESCNAFADGRSINFYRKSDMCNNTASLASVVYHEYGHNFHFALSVGGVDGGVSEGFGDIMSQSILKTPVVGPYFRIGDPSGIRNAEPDKVWPDDAQGEVHAVGLVIGGAFWDLRKEMVARYGYVQGHLTTDRIFASSVRSMGNTGTGYESALLADDDNGNLDDGTPNECLIRRAYSYHGYVEDDSMPIEMAHTPVDSAKPEEAIEINATVSVGNDDECSKIGTIRMQYAIGAPENWEDVEMESVSGDDYRAEIPAQPEDTEVYYRVEAIKEKSGEYVRFPANEAEPYYKIYIGPLEEVACEDFESSASGWEHDAEAGDDDWMMGSPSGEGGDPDKAASGSKVWGNTLDDEGQYPLSAKSSLTSPKFDLSDHNRVRLQFRRWLNVQDGEYDRARIYVNDNEVWSNAASGSENGWVHHSDQEWILVDLDISEHAGGEADVKIRWELESDGKLTMGGWNIDDVCIYAIPEEEDDSTSGEDDDESTSDEDEDDTTPSDEDQDDESDKDDDESEGDDDKDDDESASVEDDEDEDDKDDDDKKGKGDEPDGCGCVAGNPSRGNAVALLSLGLLGFALRRRRR